MVANIDAAGFVGIAFETTYGTYAAPTKFIPIRSESFQYVEDRNWRRPIRGNLVEVLAATAGPARVEGEISFDIITDALVYFMHAARVTVTKTGAGPYTYVYKGSAHGVAQSNPKSLSITTVRNGVVFGYRGCSIGSMSITIEDGLMVGTMNVVGLDEASQSLPTPAWPTTSPFGFGQYLIEVPTATQIFDVDTFEFSFDDNIEPQYRLKNTTGSQFTKYGERQTTLTMERDFESRTDYDAFKALTAQSVTVTATKGASESVAILMPSAIKDSYDLGLSGQGDLTRAAITYQGAYNSTTNAGYQMTVITAESIV